MRSPRRVAPVLAAAMALAVLWPALPAAAFKPYSHVVSGQSALADATDDGAVTIAGRSYALRPEVVDALRQHPSAYIAGAVGPDGFPDLTFGQSIIHPDRTGRWLDHVLTRAWQAQGDPSRSASEKAEILAFAYGYITHASGDLWAHTMVNDFAHGIFPGVGDILTDVDKAEIALRHIIVEGYIGDVTVGYDGNPDRTTLPDGDVSDDSTPAIAFDAPHDFVYDILVDPHATLPVGTCGDGVDDDGDGVADDGCPGGAPFTVGDPEPARGPLIDYFIDLQSDLQLEEAVVQADRTHTDCALSVDWDCYERPHTVTVHTVRGLRQETITRNLCIGANVGCLADPIDGADDLAVNPIIESYLEAWMDDIVVGLQHWNELGLASTKALFDPQAYRNAQNDECQHHGGEHDQARIDCEDGVGKTDVLFREADPFINDHLLSMLGLPDAVGDAREALQAFSDVLDDILGPALNPLRLAEAEVKEAAKQLVIDFVRDSYGIDVEQLDSFLSRSTYWLDVRSASIDLGPLGTQQLDLFSAGEHQRLDALLGLTPDDFEETSFDLPDGTTVSGRALKDSAEFSDLAIFTNTVTTNKLLLLDAAGLNAVSGDLLAADGIVDAAGVVGTYADRSQRPANVMVDGFGGTPWLTTIDGDHGWRHDGLPRFPDDEAHGHHDEHGGAGNFPLWESCLLRPAFRGLFTDWETDPAHYVGLSQFPIDHPNFPALGDETSADPSDSAPPQSSVTPDGGRQFTGADGTLYVDEATSWAVTASDAVFAEGSLDVEQRIRVPADAGAAWSATSHGAVVGMPQGSADGPHLAETRAGDPCHAIAGTPASATAFTYDTTAPSIDVTSPVPEGVVFDTDDTSTITWTADDGVHGSGVATESSTFDGAPTSQGALIDAFWLYPGVHTVAVTATDNLGHVGGATRKFKVEATSASLLSNVERAWQEGLITSTGTHSALSATLSAAVAAHDRGQHDAEAQILGGFVRELAAASGRFVDSATADRWTAHALDIIARGD